MITAWQIGLLIALALLGANLPFANQRILLVGPSRITKSLAIRLAELVLLYFVVGAVGALHLLRDRTNQGARVMFSMAMWMAVVVAPLQIGAGDAHGINTLEHQPAKVMAMEGHYESHPDGAPLILFGIPNPEAKRIDYAVQIPYLSSLILEHSLTAPLAGLDTIDDALEPPVAILFWSFRLMVGIGFAMLGLGLWSLIARYRRQLAAYAVALEQVLGEAIVAGVLVHCRTSGVAEQIELEGWSAAIDELRRVMEPAS